MEGNRERFVAALKARGVVVAAGRGGVAVRGLDDRLCDLVRDALVEAEAPLRRMAPGRRQLAELFTGVEEDSGEPKEEDR